MKKRLFLLIFIMATVLIIASLLSACSASDPTQVEQERETPQPQASEEQKSEPEPEVVEEAPLELSAILIQYGPPPGQDNELWKTIQDRMNVKLDIDWSPNDGYTDKLNVLLSTGDLPDLVFTHSITEPIILRGIRSGIFSELTPILGDFSEWPNLENINPDAWTTSKIDGKNFLFPRSRDNYDMPIAILRGDWLDELNMDIPKTIDEFADYLRGITAPDFVGKKHTNIVGVTNLAMAWMPDAFGPGNKLIVRPEGRNTGIVRVELTESYALALEYWRNLYKEGLVSSEYAMLNQQKQEEMFVGGVSGMYTRNIWHRKRMDNELQEKTDPNAYAALMFVLEGPGGKAFHYDQGYAGGLLVSGKVGEEKLLRIVKLMNQSSDPKNFNFLMYGEEGIHHTIVDGFPKLTTKGEAEVTIAMQYPFTMASTAFSKVDSPLADAAYNLATRKMTEDALKPVFESYLNPLSLGILPSESWSTFWSQRRDEFNAFIADVVTGGKTIDEFRSFQQRLLEDPLVIKSFDELQQSYDNFGLPKQ